MVLQQTMIQMKHQHILQQQLMEVCEVSSDLWPDDNYDDDDDDDELPAQQADAGLAARAAARRVHPADGGAATPGPGRGRGEAGEAAPARDQVQTRHPQAEEQARRVGHGQSRGKYIEREQEDTVSGPKQNFEIVPDSFLFSMIFFANEIL